MKNKKELNKHNRSNTKRAPTLSIDKRYYIGLFIIALITFVAYLPALQNGFVWDDDDYIRNNPLVRSINIKEIFSQFVMGNYHPLTILGHAFQFQLFELSEKMYQYIDDMIPLFG